jgi:hypothetical protein
MPDGKGAACKYLPCSSSLSHHHHLCGIWPLYVPLDVAGAGVGVLTDVMTSASGCAACCGWTRQPSSPACATSLTSAAPLQVTFRSSFIISKVPDPSHFLVDHAVIKCRIAKQTGMRMGKQYPLQHLEKNAYECIFVGLSMQACSFCFLSLTTRGKSITACCQGG